MSDEPAAKKLKMKDGSLGRLKRPKSTNASASQPNSTRVSVSSASGAHDPVSAEPIASSGNATFNQDPTAPSQSAIPPSSSVPDLLGSAVGQAHGRETSLTSTPPAQPALTNFQTQVPDWNGAAKDGLGVASRLAQTLLKKVSDCVDSNPVEMAFVIAKVIIEMKDSVEGNKDELGQCAEETANRLQAVERAIVGGVPKHAEQAMGKLTQILGEEMKKLEDLAKKSLAVQIFDHEEYESVIQQIFQRINEATTPSPFPSNDSNTSNPISAPTIERVDSRRNMAKSRGNLQDLSHSNIRSGDGGSGPGARGGDIWSHNVNNFTNNVFNRDLLERLCPSVKADHKTVLEEQGLKREECTPETRVKILEDITKWANDRSSVSPRVFWLTGQAGSGKTTIAYTIARRFEKGGGANQYTILGGNFLCSRQFEETQQRTRIIPTIAYQLARKCKSYADALHVTDKFDAVNHDVSTQLKDLLVGPWQQSEATRGLELPPYLVVIDALDEIKDNGGSAFLRDLLTAINKDDLRGLKFLVTSRPNPEVAALCDSFASCRLQDVPIAEAKSDIEIYLKTKLPMLAGSPELAELGRRAGGLFIYAATAVKYLTRRVSITAGVQTEMLNDLLSKSYEPASASKATFLIDELYRRIMCDAFSELEGKFLTRRLRILHTFLCTVERTSTSIVAALISDVDDEARAVLRDLHAVLYTEDDRVYWYHASFPDFIFDQARSNFRIGEEYFEFWCNEPAHHNLLGESCFRVMEMKSSGLRFNMGNITSSFLFDCDHAVALSEQVNKNINPVLRYSSCHWAYHLPSPTSIDTNNLRRYILEFLQIRVLFWIEAMNLLGFRNQCTPMLQRARQWVLTCGNSYLELARDIGEAANFATYFTGSPAAESTPHLYVSALATWSQDTSLCQNWKKQFCHIPIFTHTKGSITLPLMTIRECRG